MSTYSTSYKQPNPKNYPKPPFTPVQQSQAPNNTQAQPVQVSYQQQQQQQAQQNPQQSQQPQQNTNQRQMYMPQQQVAAVLTHQPPPQPPPPSQQQSNQPGQNPAASRGIPPPPQPQQNQNYPQQNTNSQNQQAPPQPQPNTVFLPPQQSFNPDMYSSYQRSIPTFIPNPAGQNPPQNYLFVNPNFVPQNQNHPQAPHFDPSHVQNVPQPHPPALYIQQGTQGMFQPAPFLYQQTPQWIQTIPQQQPGHVHRANLAQTGQQSGQNQPVSQAPQTPNQVTPNPPSAQQTDNLTQPVPAHSMPHYPQTNPQILPGPVPVVSGPSLAYQPYTTFTPTNLIAQPAPPQPYQKREKKPLLIVDPNTKQAINKTIDNKTATQPQIAPTQAQPQQPQPPKPEVSTSQPKVEKKEEKPVVEEAKKTPVVTTSSDIQAQVLRNIREQQNKSESETSDKKPAETTNDNTLTKPVSKQVTVSVQQAQQQPVPQAPTPAPQSVQQPQITPPTSYSSVITKPKVEVKAQPPPVAKSDDNNNKKIEEVAEKLSEVKLEPEVEKKVEEPVVVEEVAVEAEAEEEEKQEPDVQVEHQKPEKRRYDREFLLSLQGSKLSLQFPEQLKDLEIFQDLKLQPRQPYGSFTKSSYGGANQGDQQYGKGSMNKKMGPKYGSMGKFNKGSMEGGRPGSNITINIPDKDLPLKRADNPYTIRKPSNEHEELIREVRNILNKLTPQNLQKLTGDLINLPINTEDRLKDSIHVIFEKSLDEQVFSQTYAELCRILAQIKVPLNSDPTKFINYRTMLLTKCQKEFDCDYAQNINYEKLLAEAETEPDETKKAELKEIANDKLVKAKRRSLGNIRFIGELFKLKMLTEGIMNDCIERLLKQENDEENLECLCKLLTTIGKELDKPTNGQRMKNCFDKLDRISRKKELISSRIRFMIMDVIDLRKNNWVPRRKDAGPKKIDDIRREAEEEQIRLEAEIAKQQSEKRQQGQKGKYNQNISKSTSMDSEAFHARSTKTQNGSMVNKIKDVKQITIKNLNGELTLGPGGGAGYGWNKPKPAQEAAIPQSASFSAQKRVAEPVSRLSMDSKSAKPDRVQAVKRMDSGDYSKSDSSQASSRDNSQTRAPIRKSYNEDEIERKAANLLDELGEHKNVEESLKDLEEFIPADSEQYSVFVQKLIYTTLERNETIRTLLGHFFYVSLKDKKLELNRFEQGLKRVIQESDDMSIDVPKISSYLAQIIAQMLNENFSIEFLKTALEPIKEIKLCADIVSESLNRASDRLGHSSVSDIFKASNLHLNDFLQGVDDANEFVREQKLQWLNGQTRERTQSSSVTVESYENKLNQILTPTNENTAIFDKVENEFSPNECNTKAFIRALVISVCNSCYNNNKFDAELFKNRAPILNKYIGKKEDLELESLFAIQALDHRMKHQPGYIRIVFDLLYDEDIIREDVFWTWKGEDKEEGHGISVLSLKTFFEWLSEADNEANEA